MDGPQNRKYQYFSNTLKIERMLTWCWGIRSHDIDLAPVAFVFLTKIMSRFSILVLIAFPVAFAIVFQRLSAYQSDVPHQNADARHFQLQQALTELQWRFSKITSPLYFEKNYNCIHNGISKVRKTLMITTNNMHAASKSCNDSIVRVENNTYRGG